MAGDSHRYFRTECAHEDLRKVRSTIARMRGEFAAARGGMLGWAWRG